LREAVLTNDPKFPQRLDPAAEKIRRRRSIAIALTLGFMVLAFYVATFVHLGGNVAKGVM